jgi:hypothetical protein
MLISIVVACNGPEENTTMWKVQSEENQTVSDFTAEDARSQLRQHLSENPFLKNARVSRMPKLDVASYYAFSAVPPYGRVGEAVFLVTENTILSSTQPIADFKKLMVDLGVGQSPDALEISIFASLFLRFHVLRRGIVLEQPDGHPLLQENPIPPNKFTQPQSTFDEQTGAHYVFWAFDTDRMKAILWEVQVSPDGTTSYTSSE